MLHLATVTHGLQEFVVMHCVRGSHKGSTYIEEVVLNTVDWDNDVFANCKFIDDDNLANDLAEFITEQGLLDIQKRLMEGGKLWLPGSKGSKR